MYIPAPYAEADDEAALREIEAAPFATLVTLNGGGLVAGHLPLLLDRAAEGGAALIGHLARPNPHWREFDPGVDALAIFQPMHHYVSPGWYPSKREHGRVVPTWNYVAVHVYGRLEAFEDAASLRDVVTRLTDRFEAARDAPWAVTDAPSDFIGRQLKGIVGLRLRIARIEAKKKLSQNKSAADRAGVAAGLRREGGEDAAAMAAVIESDL